MKKLPPQTLCRLCGLRPVDPKLAAGRMYQCRECKNLYNRRYYRQTHGIPLHQGRQNRYPVFQDLDGTMRRLCRVCGDAKTIEQFHKRAHHSSGYATICKQCWKERVTM